MTVSAFPAPEAIRTLLHCLEDDAQLMQAFIDALEHESTLLENLDDIPALEACAQRKNSLAASLANADACRNTALAQCGFSAGKAGMNEAACAHPDVASACLRLLDLAARARELNDANGIAIQLCAEHHALALQDLRSLLGSEDLYDARGRKTSPSFLGHARIVAG